MSNVVQVRYTIAKRGLGARYNPLVRVYPSASPRVYTLTRGLWAHNPLLAIVYPIHIYGQTRTHYPARLRARVKSKGTRDELSITLYLQSEINFCSVRMPVNA